MFKFTFSKGPSRTLKTAMAEENVVNPEQAAANADHANTTSGDVKRTRKTISENEWAGRPFIIFHGDINYNAASRPTEKPAYVIVHSSLRGSPGAQSSQLHRDLERDKRYVKVRVPFHRYSMHGSLARLAPDGMDAYVEREVLEGANRGVSSLIDHIDEGTLSRALKLVTNRKPELKRTVRNNPFGLEAAMATGNGTDSIWRFFTDKNGGSLGSRSWVDSEPRLLPTANPLTIEQQANTCSRCGHGPDDHVSHEDNNKRGGGYQTHPFLPFVVKDESGNYIDGDQRRAAEASGLSITLPIGDGKKKKIYTRALRDGSLPLFDAITGASKRESTMAMIRIGVGTLKVKVINNSKDLQPDGRVQSKKTEVPGGFKEDDSIKTCGTCDGTGKANVGQRDGFRINRLSLAGALRIGVESDPITGGLIFRRKGKAQGDEVDTHQVTPDNSCTTCQGSGKVVRKGRTIRAAFRKIVKEHVASPVFLKRVAVNTKGFYLPKCSDDCHDCHGDPDWQDENGNVCQGLVADPGGRRASIQGVQYLNKKDRTIDFPYDDFMEALARYHESLGGQETNPHEFSALSVVRSRDADVGMATPNRKITISTEHGTKTFDPSKDLGTFIDVSHTRPLDSTANKSLPQGRRVMSEASTLTKDELAGTFGYVKPSKSIPEADFLELEKQVDKIRSGKNASTIGASQERELLLNYLASNMGRMSTNLPVELPTTTRSTIKKKVYDTSKYIQGVTVPEFTDIPSGKVKIVMPNRWDVLRPSTWKDEGEINEEPDSVDVHLHERIQPSVSSIQDKINTVIGPARASLYQTKLDDVYASRSQIEDMRDAGAPDNEMFDKMNEMAEHYKGLVDQLSKNEHPDAVDSIKKSMSGITAGIPNLEGNENEKE